MRFDTVFRGQAQRHSTKTAVICGDARVTYAELASRVARIAGALRRRGLGAGDRVVVYLPNGVAAAELMLAAFTAGAIVVPVTTRLTPRELAYVCDDSTPKAIAFSSQQRDAIAPVLAAHAHALAVSSSAAPGAVTLDDLAAEEAGPLPLLDVEADDAMIMYTSGTTGKPKGAIITHANIVTQHAYVNGVEWGISHDDIYLVTTPLTHRTGFARLSNAMLLGGTVVVTEKFDPAAVVDLIARERVTVAGMVPTVCRMLLPFIEAQPERCASLRRIVVTGEAFPVELKRRLIALLPQVRLFSFFAMTEAGSVTSLSHEEQFTHPTSVGRMTPGVEARIVDERGEDVACGEPGEFLVRSGAPGRYSIMRGYYGRPAETAAAFIHGWFRTGDIVRMDEDGYLYVVDRKKDMILSGGFNIYTREVEQALITHPAVADVAVIGVPDPVFGEAVAAFVECVAGGAIAPEVLVEHARAEIASYKKPKYVFVVPELPRNALGKVLKHQLREMAREKLAG